MKTVILGGSGFIGNGLARHLLSEGQQVVTVSRSPMRQLAPEHRHRDITLDDRRTLTELLQDADFVFHLASDSTPGSSKLQPGLEVSNNLLPLAGLLEALQALPGPTLVYISSGGAVYDTRSVQGPIAESSPTAPPSYYGAAKLAAEALIQAYSQQTGHSALSLRPANIYGPGQIPKKQFGIVPTLCECLASDQPITLWGDGSAVRDYVYISDFLDLCARITRHNWPAGTREVLNVGSGQGCSITALCQLLEIASGKQLTIEQQPARGVDIPEVVLDATRARELLDWEASTELEDGLVETWRWFTQRQT